MSRLFHTAAYSLAGLVVVVGLAVSRLGRFRVDVPLTEKTMRPAIGADETSFDVDPGWVDSPHREDIVAFVPPDDERGKHRVTRVVAVPGDRVVIREHKLYVNGAEPPHLKRSLPVESSPEVVVPRDCVYVLDDVSGNTDSLRFGPLPLWRVAGRLIVD